ncbi:MAG: M90 family metallopeptidase [Pseudomonadota bacterium]
MSGTQILFITVAVLLLSIFSYHAYIAYRRKKIMSLPLNPEWAKILNRNLSIYKVLPPDIKEQLHNLMKVFIAEKNFEGCGGIEMNEEIKVTVSAQACMLLLNRRPSFYPGLSSIIIYPSSFFAKDVEYVSPDHYIKSITPRIGESWKSGMVILAWDHVKNGAMDMDDGHNVVFHEFAHQLDEEDEKKADGVPVLRRPSSYLTWARVFLKEFRKLKKEIFLNKETVIDDYGSKSPAEFFAVVTEAFFEKPVQLKTKHPALYNILRDYYNLDPAVYK